MLFLASAVESKGTEPVKRIAAVRAIAYSGGFQSNRSGQLVGVQKEAGNGKRPESTAAKGGQSKKRRTKEGRLRGWIKWTLCSGEEDGD